MTIQELQLLADGFTFGSSATLGLHIIQGVVDDRRDARRARRQARIDAADRYYRSLRPYQREARFAKRFPAGVLELSARHIELDLHDGQDRVERAARNEGLL